MSDHYDRYNGMENLLGTNLAEVGTDCISRRAAIDALNEYFSRIGKLKRRGLTKGEKAISLDTVGAINSLPSAELKRGKWIDIREYTEWYAREYECSECGGTMLGESNFCPNCGADMREKGENNESN